jgi:hypothetical protein
VTSGRCHCGAVRYRVDGDQVYSAVCHCEDCRRSSGAVSVGWIAFPATALTVEHGETREYASSENGRRQFCPTCGTGLFYYNEAVLPGLVDIQLTTLEDPASHPPQIHVQTADELPWEAGLGELPRFERYPGP